MKRSRLLFAAIAVTASLTLTACGHTSQSSAKKHYSEVYISADSHVYTRCYDSNSDAFVWYLLYVNNQAYASQSQSSVSSSALSGAAWRSSSAPSSGRLTDTKQVIEEDEEDQPGTDPEGLESASDVETDGTVVSEDTTSDEAQQDFSDDNSDANQGDDGTGGDSGSGDDSGGGDTGGDSGGSDGGGD